LRSPMITAGTPGQMLADALDHLQAAIELLDRAEAPGQIAAQIDLAFHQLDRILAQGTKPMSWNAREQGYGSTCSR
jgi:hypothetical protein